MGRVIFFLPSPSPSFALAPLAPTVRKGYYFYSPQSSTVEFKDGGYNNITNTNKVSPTQNTPALQARKSEEKRWFSQASRTVTKHGNVYRSVRKKQEIAIHRQRVLQAVTSLRVVTLVFGWHNRVLKISNINPQEEARFSLWKKLVP